MTEKSESFKEESAKSDRQVGSDDLQNGVNYNDAVKTRDCPNLADPPPRLRGSQHIPTKRKLQIEIQKHSIINILNPNDDLKDISPHKFDDQNDLSIEKIERSISKDIQNPPESETFYQRNLEIESKTISLVSSMIEDKELEGIQNDTQPENHFNDPNTFSTDLDDVDCVSSVTECKSLLVNPKNEMEEDSFTDLLIPAAAIQMDIVDCETLRIEKNSPIANQDYKGDEIIGVSDITNSQSSSNFFQSKQIVLNNNQKESIFQRIDESNISKDGNAEIIVNTSKSEDSGIKTKEFNKNNNEVKKEISRISLEADIPCQSLLDNFPNCSNSLPTETVFTSNNSKEEEEIFKPFESDEIQSIEDPNNTTNTFEREDCLQTRNKDEENFDYMDPIIIENESTSNTSSTYLDLNFIFPLSIEPKQEPDNRKQLKHQNMLLIDSQSDSIFSVGGLGEDIADDDEHYSVPISSSELNHLKEHDDVKTDSPDIHSTYQDINFISSPTEGRELELTNRKQLKSQKKLQIDSQSDSILCVTDLDKSLEEDFQSDLFQITKPEPTSLKRQDKIQIDSENELSLNKKEVPINSEMISETEIMSTYIEIQPHPPIDNGNLRTTNSLPKASSTNDLEYHKESVDGDQIESNPNALRPPKPLPRHKMLPINVQKPERPPVPPKIPNPPSCTKPCPPRPTPIPAPRTKRVSSLNDMRISESVQVEQSVEEQSESSIDEAINKTHEKKGKLKKYKNLFGKLKTRIKINLKPETNEKPTKFYIN